MSFKFNILLSLIISGSLVVDGKFLSSLFNKGNSNCAPSAPFRMPRLPSLASLLCSQGQASYMNSWGYPGYSGGYSTGYNMYPSMGGAYASSSYPSSSYPNGYGNSNWAGNNGWTYTPSSWYGSTSQPYRNDARKGREYSADSYEQQQPQQQQQQQQSQSSLDTGSRSSSNSGSSYSSGNFASSRYSYHGGKSNSNSNSVSSKFVPMSSSKLIANDLIQQQMMHF